MNSDTCAEDALFRVFRTLAREFARLPGGDVVSLVLLALHEFENIAEGQPCESHEHPPALALAEICMRSAALLVPSMARTDAARFFKGCAVVFLLDLTPKQDGG